MGKTSAELRKELEEVEKAERDAREELRRATPIQWKFTLKPHKADARWDRVYDPSCSLYRLEGKIANRNEAREVGHHIPQEGGMVYVFNTNTGLLIMPIGGGTIWVSEPAAFARLSAFLVENPDGGDVTAIVSEYRPGGER